MSSSRIFILGAGAIGSDYDAGLSEKTNFSSMGQDLAGGSRTEIDFLNGKSSSLGKKHLIQTPVSEASVSFIKFLEREDGIPREN